MKAFRIHGYGPEHRVQVEEIPLPQPGPGEVQVRVRACGMQRECVDLFTKLTRATTTHPDRLKETLARIPARRMGTPGDMAGAALFLASPLVDYIVGQTLIVDGGLSA